MDVHIVTLLREMVCEPFLVWVVDCACCGTDCKVPEKEGRDVVVLGVVGSASRMAMLGQERAQSGQEIVEREGDEEGGI